MDSDTLGTGDSQAVGARKRPGAWGRRLFISVAVFTVGAVAGCGSALTTGADPASKVVTAVVPTSATAGASPAGTRHKPAPHKTTATSKLNTAIPSPSPSTTYNATGACVTTAAKGSCGPYTYPQIQGNPSGISIGQDVWNPISGWQQTLAAANPGNWQVTANMPDENTAVISFPNTGAGYNSPQLSSFPAIYSSISETMGSSSATNAHAAYDLWFNDWKNEVMIQTDFAPSGARCSSSRRRPPSAAATVSRSRSGACASSVPS